MDEILKLLKLDLAIMHDKRDEYLRAVIAAAQTELKEKGIGLDITKVEDQLLIADYAAWKYRKRAENVPLSQNLQWRIRNRIVKERAKCTTV